MREDWVFGGGQRVLCGHRQCGQPGFLEFKEGKIGVAFEVEVGVNLGRVESDG